MQEQCTENMGKLNGRRPGAFFSFYVHIFHLYVIVGIGNNISSLDELFFTCSEPSKVIMLTCIPASFSLPVW